MSFFCVVLAECLFCGQHVSGQTLKAADAHVTEALVRLEEGEFCFISFCKVVATGSCLADVATGVWGLSPSANTSPAHMSTHSAAECVPHPRCPLPTLPRTGWGPCIASAGLR